MLGGPTSTHPPTHPLPRMGATSGFGCVNFTSTHVSYGNVAGPTVGVPIARIIREPPLYGGHKVRPASSPSPPHAPPTPARASAS